MVRHSRVLAAIIMLLVVVGTLVILSFERPNSNSTFEDLKNPSIPEFNATATDHSYYVYPLGHVNPKTGRTDTFPGGFVRNGSVVVNIKNQPFKSYHDSNGYAIQLFFHLRARSHGTSEWHYYPNNKVQSYLTVDNSSTTKVVFTYREKELQMGINNSLTFSRSESFDFEVETFIGYRNVTVQSIAPYNAVYDYVGYSSGWSDTQTVTIPASTAYIPATPASPIPTSPPDTAVVSLKIQSPKENASYTNGTINVCFTKEVNSIGVSTWVNVVSTYQGDWMDSSKWCPFPPLEEGKDWNDFQILQHNFTLTQIPKGHHTLTIDARGEGNYNANGTTYSFQLPKKTATISFFMN